MTQKNNTTQLYFILGGPYLCWKFSIITWDSSDIHRFSVMHITVGKSFNIRATHFQHSSASPNIKYNYVILFLCQLYLLIIYASKYFLIDYHYKRYVRIYWSPGKGKIYWCSRSARKGNICTTRHSWLIQPVSFLTGLFI